MLTLRKKSCLANATNESNLTFIELAEIENYNETNELGSEKTACGYLFANSGYSDIMIGIILLIFSIIGLSVSLAILIKMLNSLFNEEERSCDIYLSNSTHQRWLSYISGYVDCEFCGVFFANSLFQLCYASYWSSHHFPGSIFICIHLDHNSIGRLRTHIVRASLRLDIGVKHWHHPHWRFGSLDS